MSISSTNSSSSMQQMMQQMQQTQRPSPPSSTQIVSEVMDASDVDKSGSLSIEEIGLSQEDFSNYDSDQNGLLSTDELETSISSKLDAMKNQELTPQSFASFLSDLGVEVPAPPSGGKGPNASQMASDIFSTKDSNQDGLMSIDELGISSELFTSLDTDQDGSITQEELEESLTTLFSSVENGETSKEEAGAVLSSLGVKPPQGGGAPAGGGVSSDEEEYDEADTNQDGVVSAAEQAAYDGTSKTEMQEYALKLVSTLLDALKTENNDNSDSMELSKFKSIMSMVNNQTQDASTANKLNSYVSNLDLGLKTA
ncbi:MAG: hypothetical protein WBG69_05060 [Arcobacteraceae bacterium]